MRVRPNKDSRSFRHLSKEKEYYVIGLDHESFRVVDDKGDPVLFPRNVFDIVDESVPQDWIWDWFSEDEFYASPPELHAPGFYEDFFERKEEAVRQFESYLQRVGRVHSA
jgi:hypothetical protein